MASQLPAEILQLVMQELSSLEDLLSLALVNKRHFNLLFAPILQDPIGKEATALFKPFLIHVIEVHYSYRDISFYAMLGPYKHGRFTGWQMEGNELRNYLQKFKNLQNIFIYSTETGKYEQTKKIVEAKGWISTDGDYIFGHSQGKKKYYYRNHTIKAIESYVDGKQEGVATTYYQGDKVQDICTYKNGALDGLKMTYSRMGYLSQITPYSAGLRHGEAVTYDLQAQHEANYKLVTLREHHENGQRCGTREQWFPSGVLQSLETFQNDFQRIGLSMQFTENGHMFYKSIKDDRGFDVESRTWDPNGVLTAYFYQTSPNTEIREYYLPDGRLQSKWKYETDPVTGGTTWERLDDIHALGANA